MATPSSTRQPVSDHYASQVGLAVALEHALRALWPSLDTNDMHGSLPVYKARIFALVRQFGLSSASLSAAEYRRERVNAGIRSNFTVPGPHLPPLEQVDTKIGWAVSDLWDQALLADPVKAPKVLEVAQTQVEGAATKLVLDTGRELTIEAVQEDRKAVAWARETQPGCCYWCAMLAGRGAVYKSAHSAGENNAFHNHDKCAVVPVFGQYEPSAHARQWAAEWRTATKGLSGADAVLAWRQHFEGRPAT